MGAEAEQMGANLCHCPTRVCAVLRLDQHLPLALINLSELNHALVMYQPVQFLRSWCMSEGHCLVVNPPGPIAALSQNHPPGHVSTSITAAMHRGYPGGLDKDGGIWGMGFPTHFTQPSFVENPLI